MSRVLLPKQLVLGDFSDAAETLSGHVSAWVDGGEPLTIDAGEVRRVDGSGLQWLLGCLTSVNGGSSAVRLESNAVVDEAMRVSGVSALLAERTA